MTQALLWRARAEELRVIAECTERPGTQSDLVWIADQWEKMANNADLVARWKKQAKLNRPVVGSRKQPDR
jgi:hypothetical protein